MMRDQLDWLASLARMDIRKRQRALAKFAAKPGQDPAEAEAFREKMAADLAWKQEVLAALDDERRGMAANLRDVLTALARHDADDSVSALHCGRVAGFLDVTPRQAERMLDALYRDGMVFRVSGPSHGNGYAYGLTREGRERMRSES